MYFFYYLPVGVDATSKRTPIITIFFATVCVAVFLLNKLFPDTLSLNFYNFIYYPYNSPWYVSIASIFLHFGWFHLIGNLLYMLLFGWYLEERLGTVLYGFVFFGSAIAGNLLQGLINHNYLSAGGMGIIGASGAVSGVLGAFLVRLYMSNVRVAYWVFMPLLAYTKAGKVSVPFVFAMVLWVLMQSARGFMQFEGASANVAHFTHLGGFLFGIALALATGQHREGRLEGYLIRARRALQKADFWSAHDELCRYVEQRPDDGSAHADLARACVQAGHRGEGAKHYRRACRLLLDEGNRQRAEQVYLEAARGFSGFAMDEDTQLELAFGLERNLKYDAALRAYENFRTNYPLHPEAPFALLRAANILRSNLGESRRAREHYEDLISDYPNDAWVDFAREQVRRLA